MKILIIGGNRFFGKRLASILAEGSHQVTLLNRGNIDDGLRDRVTRLTGDRTDFHSIKKIINDKDWDVVIDQVCFEPADAYNAVKLFSGKTAHYMFTSSQAVYDPGILKTESDFDARKYPLSPAPYSYAEAKRLCEKVFIESELPVTCVRFPVVLGPDDYTERIEFHIERVQKSQPIYMPNPEAQYGFLSSEDAALSLEHLIKLRPQGALNVSPGDHLSLKELLVKIQALAGGDIVFADRPDSQNKSPYGFTQDWTMSVAKLESLGFRVRPTDSWLSPLLSILVQKVNVRSGK